jgi:thioredoxin reductase
VESAIALADFGKCASVSISYRRNAFARCRAENRRRIDALVEAGRVQPLMPSEIVRIEPRSVVLRADGRETALPNDDVIVQIGGTASAELLQSFGIHVVTKRGEA